MFDTTLPFDELFPLAGGLQQLSEIREKEFEKDDKEVEGSTFTRSELKHLNKMFDLLKDDELARATLASLICYCNDRSLLAKRADRG